MMYLRKPTFAEAWQFNGEPYANWPAFVREFSTHTMSGARSPSMNVVGLISIPSMHGPDLQAHRSDWVVLENHKLTIVRGNDFANQFDEVAQAADAE